MLTRADIDMLVDRDRLRPFKPPDYFEAQFPAWWYETFVQIHFKKDEHEVLFMLFEVETTMIQSEFHESVLTPEYLRFTYPEVYRRDLYVQCA